MASCQVVVDGEKLCSKCGDWNSGLGLFRDDPKVLALAIDYLESHLGEL